MDEAVGAGLGLLVSFFYFSWRLGLIFVEGRLGGRMDLRYRGLRPDCRSSALDLSSLLGRTVSVGASRQVLELPIQSVGCGCGRRCARSRVPGRGGT